MLRLRQRQEDAVSLFERLAGEYDAWQAVLGLAGARLVAGDPAAAAAALERLLSRYAVAEEAAVAPLADGVAAAVGAVGWCGLSADGTLIVRSAAPVVAQLDGRKLDGLELPRSWQGGTRLTVTAGGADLLGSPIDLAALRRAEGTVRSVSGGLSGWVWQPGRPAAAPVVTVREAKGGGSRRVTGRQLAGDGPPGPPRAAPRRFAVPAGRLDAMTGRLHVLGPDGRDLAGSPLDPAREAKSPPLQAVAEPRQSAAAVWRGGQEPGQASVILVTHHLGGGVERVIAARCAALRAKGYRPVVLRPGVWVTDSPRTGDPDLRFHLPREWPGLIRLLRDGAPAWVELHHLLEHDPSMLELPEMLDVPFEVFVHDYAWFCPRIVLIGASGRYCGEPALRACVACVAELGANIHETIGVAALRRRSAAVLRRARRVIAPSADAAARTARHFAGVTPEAVPLEDDAAIPAPARHATMARHVCVPGAIGPPKGYDVLLACARDAAERDLNLAFTVVGHTMNDSLLMATGRVFVTGEYKEEEAVRLIRAQRADLAFVPSVWPETWCFALSQAWRAGLQTVAFDIGAQAERIRATGYGWLLPLDLGAPAVNDALLALPQPCPVTADTP